MYFFRDISNEVRVFQLMFHQHKTMMKFMIVSMFACIAAILQSAGGYLPGIGLFLSPLATAPILLCSMFSISSGIKCYFLTILLLCILQPTELMVFPFTTGLLGLGIGSSFCFFKKRVNIIATGAILLFLGIMSLLYAFQFPVLGPGVSDSISIFKTGGIFLFTLLYSWMWVEIGLIIFFRIKIIFIN
ncbi:hypothetical protein [Bacillus sp. OAE603]|uniref:hypothetical protein n=1 Tax=Gottfriedia sp. OAE603 TaxID=2663872 RepID=UPI00178A73C6